MQALTYRFTANTQRLCSSDGNAAWARGLVGAEILSAINAHQLSQLAARAVDAAFHGTDGAATG